MKLPRGLARFNKVVTNRVQGVYAWAAPPWAVILHRGRRSGRDYRTPVLAFRHDEWIVVALLYGEESAWVRNVLAAGGGSVVRAGRTYRFSEPRVVDVSGPEVAALRPAVRRYVRLADRALVARLGERTGGFGPGRQAG